ncbi:MAG: nitroreductase family protein [Selenomonadaceae bacterium]|nr:nitroreductase family protein [Selenomonadaceae bacterium]
MIKSVTVDAGKCIHCGMCIRDCVVGCIEFDEEKIPRYVEGGEKICVGCQHCMAICPKGALSFGGKKPDESDAAGYVDSEELLRLIKSRRSVRFFQSKDVPPEKISALVDMLAFPPKGGNADSLHFSIVGTAEKMRAIKNFTYETIQAAKNSSPVIEFFRENYNKGIDFIYRAAPSMVAVSVNKEKAVAGCENADPIIALSYLELYAQSLGVGTLWCDAALTVANELPEVKALFEIPDGFELNYIMLLGVPAIKYKRTVQREPANVKII